MNGGSMVDMWWMNGGIVVDKWWMVKNLIYATCLISML